jgi:protein-disulfide isomerase
MTKQRLINGAVVVLAACALAQTAVVLKREFVKPQPAQVAPTKTKNWKHFAQGTIVGPSQGPITVVEFSDFQCPYCRRFAATLDTVRAQFPKTFRVLFRHYPLEQIHPSAFTAAVAAECAAEQNRFKEYHDQLFAHQDSIGHRTWVDFARNSGITDTARFLVCINSNRYAARIKADLQAGEELGVTGTPTILINDRRYSGSITTSDLIAIARKHNNRKS